MDTDAARYQLVAAGGLLIDHVFAGPVDNPTYVGTAGGGSSFNLAVSFAALGNTDVFAVSTAGDDALSDLAVEQLVQLGVDTSRVMRKPGASIDTIFQVLLGNESRLFDGDALSNFKQTCLVCGNRPPVRTTRLTGAESRSLDDLVGNAARRRRPQAIAFDRLTVEHADAARRASGLGALTTLDLGHLGFVRGRAPTETVALLNDFDVVLLPMRVAKHLISKIGASSLIDLARLGPRRLLLVSDGPRGVRVLQKVQAEDVLISQFAAPMFDSIVDDTGAGDAMFAGVVSGLLDQISTGEDEIDAEAAVRESIAALAAPLGSVGARGHLPGGGPVPASWLARWEGASVSEIAKQIGRRQLCPFCASALRDGAAQPPSIRGARRSQRPKSTSRQNSGGLLKRRMFNAVDQPEAIEQIREINASGGTAAIVGSGGSFSAAVFVCSALSENSGLFARAMRPYEFIQSTHPVDHVVILSYSGSTPDCEAAIRHAHRIGCGRVHLLTASRAPKLARSLRSDGVDGVIAYGGKSDSGSGRSGERGFVSMAGTVAPAALWVASIKGADEMTTFALEMQARFAESNSSDREIARKLVADASDRSALNVIGTGLAWPSAVDLESKFVEGSIGTIQLHESKDFSHGRFMSVFHTHPRSRSLFLAVPPMGQYDEFLRDILIEETNASQLVADNFGLLGALELLVRCQAIAEECGALLGTDISRPGHVPQAGLSLYQWPHALD